MQLDVGNDRAGDVVNLLGLLVGPHGGTELWGMLVGVLAGSVVGDIGAIGAVARIFRGNWRWRRNGGTYQNVGLVLLDLGLDLVDLYIVVNIAIIDDTSRFVGCSKELLTLAVIDVENSVAVLQAVRKTADETLSALGRSVDSNQAEGTLGSRHGENVKCRTKNPESSPVATSRGFYSFRQPEPDCVATFPHIPLLWVDCPSTSAFPSSQPDPGVEILRASR